MFLDGFYADPMYFFGLLFSLVGAVGVVYFIAGFIPGLPHVFTLSSHEEHQKTYRRRAVFGVTLLTATFIVWELVRIVASWFGYPPANTGAFGVFISTLCVVLLICGVFVLINNTLSKGGH